MLDEHLPIKSDSWQLKAIKLIKKNTKHYNKDLVYCVESRNASEYELKKSIEYVNNAINKY